MMQPIQIVALLVAVIHIARLLALWKNKKIPGKTALLWFFIWAAVLFVVFFTPVIDALSRPIGVGRGIDMVVYLSVLALFYFVFQLHMKIDKLEKEITRLVREIALKK
ncbi:MAG: DUF2304 domain-containing protein [Candidatus Woesearchaeota archaeon]